MKTTAEVIKGKPCKVCGGVLRYKNSGKCIKCHEVRNKQRDRSKSGKAKTGKVLPPVIVERAVKVVPVEVTEPVNKDRRYYVTKIIAASHKAVEGILETGRLFIEARDNLNRGEFLKMIETDLPYTAGTVERFMRIASNAVLSNSAHVPNLPPSWGTLYELTKLPDRVLLAKIEDHTISPKMERKEVTALLGPAPKPKKKRDGKPKYQDDGTYEAQVEEIEGLKAYNAKLLEAVKEIDGIVIKPDDDLEAVATKVVGVIGNGNVALLIEMLKKYLPNSEAA